MYQISTLHYIVSAIAWITLLTTSYYISREIFLTILLPLLTIILLFTFLPLIWAIAFIIQHLTNDIMRALAFIFFPRVSLPELLKELDHPESQNYLKHFPNLLFAISFSIAFLNDKQTIN